MREFLDFLKIWSWMKKTHKLRGGRMERSLRPSLLAIIYLVDQEASLLIQLCKFRIRCGEL